MKFKVGDKFVLTKSGDDRLDRQFSEDRWNQVYTVNGIDTHACDYGTLYRCGNVNAVEAVMNAELYLSPLFQALL